MDNNEKGSQEEKKLQLDLREALMNGTSDDDEIIELKDEVILPPKEKEAKVDLSDPLNRKSPDDEPAEKTVIRQDLEFTFEEEDESEADAEIQPHMVEKPFETEGPDEVIEITEFDDILSKDDNEMMTLAEETTALEPEEDEEEFLELIDVEEDSFPEEEKDEEKEDENLEIVDEIIQFDGLTENIEDVELEDFINDSLNEEMRIDDDLEDDLTNSLGVEAGSEMSMLDQASEAEDLDFNIDSREISEKIDQLDTIFFDDTEAQTDFEDEIVSNDEELEEAIAITDDTDIEDDSEESRITDDELSEGTLPPLEMPGFDDEYDKIEETTAEDEESRITDDAPSEETMPAPTIAAFDTDHDKIEESIERIIQQNYSEKIESMVVKVIEKAVSKEIDRLKNILLEDNGPESS